MRMTIRMKDANTAERIKFAIGIGGTLRIRSFTQPEFGLVRLGRFPTSVQLIYEAPNNPPGYVGLDNFTYTVQDGRGGTSTATVSLMVIQSMTGTDDDDVLTGREGLWKVFTTPP